MRDSCTDRVFRRALLALLLSALLVAGLLGLRRLERAIVYPRPPADTSFSATPFEILKITDAEQRLETHALYLRAEAGAPTLVVFHGNGQQLSDMMSLLGLLKTRGLGGLVVEYPGYGLAHRGEPGEENIYLHSESAIRHLQHSLGVSLEETILVGESLGTGVAVEMAARGFGARLILLSPFASLPAVAEFHTPWFPASWVLANRYDSAKKAPAIAIPVVVIHGTDDALIPVSMGKQLAQRFPTSTFLALEGVGHGGMLAMHAEVMLNHLASDSP
jgi:pimeloyl-ACP methyl ester carboxylesterase